MKSYRLLVLSLCLSLAGLARSAGPVFDTHVHLRDGESSLQKFVAEAREAGIELAGVGAMWFGGPHQALAGDPAKMRASNDALIALAAKHPEVAPIGTVHPYDGKAALDELAREGGGFHVEGGSWTNDISWVRGYESLLNEMQRASALFHERVRASGAAPEEPRYQNALLHLMCAQTSCFRYWGQGKWTDYGRELCRRTREIALHDF